MAKTNRQTSKNNNKSKPKLKRFRVYQMARCRHYRELIVTAADAEEARKIANDFDCDGEKPGVAEEDENGYTGDDDDFETEELELLGDADEDK